MDNGHEKQAPSGIPAGSPFSSEQLKAAAEDPQLRSSLRIQLTVSGGLPSQAAGFTIALDGEGRVETAAQYRGESSLPILHSDRIDGAEVARLLLEMDGAALAAAANNRVRIPPDSVVGRLEISVAGETQQIVFMADEEQARTAGFELPPEVEHVVRYLAEIGRRTAEGAQLPGDENLQL